MSIIIEEEVAIEEMLEELMGKIEDETSSIKLSRYKKLILDLKKRKSELESFRDAVSVNIVGSDQTTNLTSMFNRVNLLLSGGFDYYYASPVVDKIRDREDLSNEKTSINMLFNEKHLDKLRKTIDCTKSLDFIKYQKDGNDKYAIWYRATPVTINLIPFERDLDNGVIIKKSNNETIHYTEDQIGNLFSRKNSEYGKLEYKTLSKSGMQIKDIRG